ncbi:hypothetical protein [Roseobacter sp.]|uniref:hypothetical protein n=1 Tax=Roseobacter sp. TaxID=1907202 RepID=UPI0032983B14
MNIPITILTRSFRLIFAEPGRTLTVITPGLLLYCLAAFLCYASLDVTAGQLAIRNTPLLLLGITLAILGWMSFAILWHRHALLQADQRTQVMRPTSGIFGLYLKSTVVIGLIMIFLAFCIGIVASIASLVLLTALGPTLGLIAATALMAVVSIALSWAILRSSLILPAAAMGHRMAQFESWHATRPISREIFWTAVLLGVLNVVFTQILGGLAVALPTYAIGLQAAQLIVQALIYVSVLSTLYGHLIQGRSLT